jgi:hypothetical protein
MTESVVDPSVTTGPIVGSCKYYRDLDGVPGARVPFRRVARRTGQDGAFLLDVRAEVLLHAHHPRHPRRQAEKSKEFADHGNQIYLPITT